MSFGKKIKKKSEDLFSLVLSQFKKYQLSGSLKIHYLGIFQSLKSRIVMEKNLKLNFNPCTVMG